MSTTLPKNRTLSRNCTVWTMTPVVVHNGRVNDLAEKPHLVQELYCLDQNTKRAQQRARQPSCPHRHREQKLRNHHSFLHCHDPAPSNHLDDVLHDLWHWSTICSASPAITLMMSSMICGTGIPRSSPRARNGLQRQGRQQPCRRTARPPPRTATVEAPQYPTPPQTRARQQPCPRAAAPPPAPPRPFPPHHPGTHFGAPGRRPRRCKMTVVSLCTGSAVRGCVGHSPDGGDSPHTESSGQQLPRECRPSSDSSRCTVGHPQR